MSATLHVITNSLGDGDWFVVYETEGGETVYEGHSLSPYHLYIILKNTLGVYDEVKYRALTNEQMENWQDHVYETSDEQISCPCGSDGGTSCGSPNCYQLTGQGYD